VNPTRGEAVTGRQRAGVHVLVVDEKGIMRDALCHLLGSFPDVSFVSGAPLSADALRSAASLRPDVVFLDFPPATQAGMRLIASLRSERPSVRIIVLTALKDAPLVESALRAGADGYLLKTDSLDELRGALASVIAGQQYVSPSVSSPDARVRPSSARSGNARQRAAPELTERELQVIRLIASGHRTREIAQVLSLSHKTIEKHRTGLMRKLGLRNASAVTAYAIAHGLAEG
jgi:DNA-binding NarL/FixJ family response regulator